MCGVPLTNSQTFYQFSCQSSSTCISERGPPSWACSCLFCAHGSVYTCTLHTDFDWTVVFPLWPLGASHPSRGHHTHTHDTQHTTQSQMLSSGSLTKTYPLKLSYWADKMWLETRKYLLNYEMSRDVDIVQCYTMLLEVATQPKYFVLKMRILLWRRSPHKRQ